MSRILRPASPAVAPALAAVLVALFASPAAAAPDDAESAIPIAKSKVDAVTIYRGQALVSRTVTLPSGRGEVQVAVDGLPHRVVGSSLSAQASAKSGVTIRSIRYHSKAVAKAPNKEVAALDDAIKKLRREQYANNQHLWLVDNKFKLLERQMGFVAPTAKQEMARGVLDPKKLAAITDANLKARADLIDEKVRRRERRDAINQEIRLLQRKRNKLHRGRHQSRRQAVIYVHKRRAGAAKVRLDYLVRGANWTPTYNVRRSGDGANVRLEYLAEVNQMSGEDWKDVKLTLSTATPQMSAQSPVLGPLWIGLTGTVAKKKRYTGGYSTGGYAASHARIRRSQQRLQSDANRSRAGWLMNKLAAEGQNLELNADADIVRAGRKAVRAAEEALAVSYELPGRMALASRSDRQLVQVAALKLKDRTFYEAVPLFSTYVTRYARIVNDSPLPLLAGTYRAYADGEFVGRGRLPVVARAQDFTVGFGADRPVASNQTAEGRAKNRRIDVIIMRSQHQGLAERMAWVLSNSERPVPIINAGSGKDQHPTQSLLDIYTLQRSFEDRGGIDGKRIVFVGDLLRGRTVRSLATLLTNYDTVSQCFVAPEPLQLAEDVQDILRSKGAEFELSEDFRSMIAGADAIYMTRVQDEWDQHKGDSARIDISRYSFTAEHLDLLKPDGVIMHPLPRRTEISTDVDRDPRAVYWRQMRNGMWVRCALLATIFRRDDRIREYHKNEL